MQFYNKHKKVIALNDARKTQRFIFRCTSIQADYSHLRLTEALDGRY